MKKRTAVIDGDMVVYRAGFASEQEIKWDDDIWTLQSSEPEMKVIIDDMIEYAVDQTQSDAYLMVFSDSRNFRYSIFPDYKANRKDKRKPLGIKAITEWAFKNHNGVRKNNLEADDVIGMLCCTNENYVALIFSKQRLPMQPKRKPTTTILYRQWQGILLMDFQVLKVLAQRQP